MNESHDDLEREKLRLEIRDLEGKLRGRWWDFLRTIVIPGLAVPTLLVAAYSFRNSVRQERTVNLQAASSRVEEGSVAAVYQLSTFGDDAIPYLVRAIDPIRKNPKNWPEQTLSILSLLDAVPFDRIPPTERAYLETLGSRGHEHLRAIVIASRGSGIADFQYVRHLVTVNTRLHALSRKTPNGWAETIAELRDRTGGAVNLP